MEYKKYLRTAKIVFPIMGVFTILLMVFLSQKTMEHTLNTSVSNAVSTIDQFRLLRKYYTENVIGKVVVDGNLKVSFDHMGKADTIPLPATMIHDMSALLETESTGSQLKLYSAFPFPNRENRTIDDFGKRALAAIRNNPDEIFTETDLTKGSEVVRVAIADKLVSDACVNCHNAHPDTPKNDWKLGDVRGVLETTVPVSKSIADNNALIFSVGFLCLVALGVFTWVLSLAMEKFFLARVRNTSEQIKTVTAELEATSNQLTQNSTTQTTAITELSATAEELVATANQISDNTKQVSASAQKTASSSASGVTSVTNAQNGMEKTKDQVQLIAQHMLELGNKSQRIGVVLDIINELSEQTNILSLNATIEAAGAGESGRRFAVVADEVRKLAERAVDSTKEIKGLITDIQQTANTTIMVTEDGTKAMDEAVTLFDSVTESLNTMKRLVDGTSVAAREIEMTTRQQTTSVEQLSAALNDINQAARQNDSSAKQTQDTIATLADTTRDFQNMING